MLDAGELGKRVDLDTDALETDAGLHLARRALSQCGTAPDYDDPGRKRVCLLEMVRRQQDRAAALGICANRVPDAPSGRGRSWRATLGCCYSPLGSAA